MLDVKHNANDELLMGYAAGALPEAFDLVVASHLSLSAESQMRLENFESIGGAIMDKEEPAAMADDALASILDRLDEPIEPNKVKAKASNSVFPTALQAYVGSDPDHVKWSSIGMGVKQHIISTQGDATVRLLKIPAGSAVPDHGHRGTELTLVLQGAFNDEFDRFARGDLEIATEEDVHTPIAEEGEDCICLAATDAPLKFNSPIVRLLQPFFKI